MESDNAESDQQHSVTEPPAEQLNMKDSIVPIIPLATIVATVNQLTKYECKPKFDSIESTEIISTSNLKVDYDVQEMDVDIRTSPGPSKGF